MPVSIQPYLLVLTGASGSGKTTLVRALAGRRRMGVCTYHFDSIGVPSREAIVAEFGSREGWQEAKTREWIERLARNPDAAAVMVLEGQMRPGVVRAAWAGHHEVRGTVALVDCSAEARRRRLAGTPRELELATAEMDEWGIYLRGQAVELDLPIIETSRRTLPESLNELEALLRRLTGAAIR